MTILLIPAILFLLGIAYVVRATRIEPVQVQTHASPRITTEPSNVLRPKRLDDIVGQEGVRQRLSIVIRSANLRQAALPHIMLSGPPGLGKTTISQCIANGLGTLIQYINAASLHKPADLLPYIAKLQSRSVVFIDEIHRLPIAVEEYLYPVVEDFHLDTEEFGRVNLPKFTLIGATTRTDLLSGPMRDRFQIKEILDYYSVADLATIIAHTAKQLGLVLPADAAEEVARRSRGTPRIANNHVQWIRDYTLGHNEPVATLPLVDIALTMQNVDQRGLEWADNKYIGALATIFKDRPVGVAAIASTIGISKQTIMAEIEPLLLREGMLALTARGRKLTEHGLAIANGKAIS